MFRFQVIFQANEDYISDLSHYLLQALAEGIFMYARILFVNSFCWAEVVDALCPKMTASASSEMIHGNLVTAPPSSRRWQRISFNAQWKSLLESVGTTHCLDDTDRESKQGACRLVKSRSRWQGQTHTDTHVCKRVANCTHRHTHEPGEKHKQAHERTMGGCSSRAKIPPRCCPSCRWLGSHSCAHSQTLVWTTRRWTDASEKLI